jgi:hypothetical protein
MEGGVMKLDKLATLIQQRHEAVAASLKEAVSNAIAAGELLLEAKKQVGHGEWLPWLAENCDISERTAQAYMRLARAPLEMRNAVADWPLREALAAIAIRKQYMLTMSCCGKEIPAGCCGADYLVIVDGEEVGRIRCKI